MMLTFVDSGVLIAASRGRAEVSDRAFAILDDPARTFASSIFVRLEVLPKAAYQKREDEVLFYETFFAAVTRWVDVTPALLDSALAQATSHGLSAVDALHIASATAVGAEELVTSERAGKPIHRAESVHVVTIDERTA